MKKAIFFIVMLAVMATSLISIDTKLSMEIWNRYVNTSIDGETTDSHFELSRGYFRLEPTFNDNVKGRFNVDFFSGKTADFKDGAGLKIKYAYLEFAYPWMLKDSKLTAGLAKTYFGTIYDWSYQTIEKDPSDMYGYCASADYGVVYGGYLPSGFGTYNFGAYNGEGYKKGTSADTNNSMALVGDLRLTPMPGIMVGGSVMMDSKNDKDATDASDVKIREDYMKVAIVGKLAYGPAEVNAQYLMNTTSYENDAKDDKKQNVMSVMPIIKLGSVLPIDLDLVARYDIYEPNSDVDDDEENLMVAGFNWNIERDEKANPILMVQANYNQKSYADDSKDSISTMMLQLRWVFAGSLK